MYKNNQTEPEYLNKCGEYGILMYSIYHIIIYSLWQTIQKFAQKLIIIGASEFCIFYESRTKVGKTLYISSYMCECVWVYVYLIP